MGCVALLPGRFDGMRVIMLPDEGNGLVRWQSIDDGEAGQCRPGPSAAAGTGDLHAFSQGAFPGFVQDFPCVRLVAGQPEVGPANPAGLPGNGWRRLAEQVDGEGRRWPGRQRPPQAAAPDEPTGWQPQHASAGSVPRAGHHATIGKGREGRLTTRKGAADNSRCALVAANECVRWLRVLAHLSQSSVIRRLSRPIVAYSSRPSVACTPMALSPALTASSAGARS
jgi:hypothetical protein